MKRTLLTLLLLATPSLATLGGGLAMARLGGHEARGTSEVRPSAPHARTLAQRTFER